MSEVKNEVKQEVRELADKLKANLSVGKDGVFTVPEDLYVKNLPEGITGEQLDTIRKHNNTFVAAAGFAVGELSIDAMKKNPELSTTTAQINTVGPDNFSFSFQKEKVVSAGLGKDAGTKTKHGVLSAKFEMHGAGSRGQLLKVKEELEASALAAFGG